MVSSGGSARGGMLEASCRPACARCSGTRRAVLAHTLRAQQLRFCSAGEETASVPTCTQRVAGQAASPTPTCSRHLGPSAPWPPFPRLCPEPGASPVRRRFPGPPAGLLLRDGPFNHQSENAGCSPRRGLPARPFLFAGGPLVLANVLNCTRKRLCLGLFLSISREGPAPASTQ